MRRFATFIVAAALALSAGAPVHAQDNQTLADIRQELSVLFVEIQRLKRQLSTTGTPSVSVGGATALDRMDRIEAELRRLTSQAEQMELRVGRIVTEGTNKIGDLEFRLCELEPKCDIASLGDTPQLGGGAPANTPAVAAPPPAAIPGSEMAMDEQADFDRARTAMGNGDYQQAANLFSAFTDTYPGGPLNEEAHFLRGEALAAMGATADAGRAYLASFSGNPSGPRAPDALLQLAVTLAELGQRNEACVMLGQVSDRFPSQPQANVAQQQLVSLGCS